MMINKISLTVKSKSLAEKSLQIWNQLLFNKCTQSFKSTNEITCLKTDLCNFKSNVPFLPDNPYMYQYKCVCTEGSPR